MSEILLGLKLYLGVIIGQVALVGIVLIVCFLIAFLCCVFGKKVDE